MSLNGSGGNNLRSMKLRRQSLIALEGEDQGLNVDSERNMPKHLSTRPAPVLYFVLTMQGHRQVASGLNEKLQTFDRRAVDGDPLDEWTMTVMRNMKRMATDEDYRRSIAKDLS